MSVECEFNDRFTVFPDTGIIELNCFKCDGPGGPGTRGTNTWPVGYHPSLDVLVEQARSHNLKHTAATAAIEFSPGDRVWPKPDSVMRLQRGPQVVIATASDTRFGEWLWLMDSESGPSSHNARWWTTEAPSEKELAEVERERRETAERQRQVTAGEFGPPILPVPAGDDGKTTPLRSTGTGKLDCDRP